jgi:hypothetical protein
MNEPYPDTFPWSTTPGTTLSSTEPKNSSDNVSAMGTATSNCAVLVVDPFNPYFLAVDAT